MTLPTFTSEEAAGLVTAEMVGLPSREVVLALFFLDLDSVDFASEPDEPLRLTWSPKPAPENDSRRMAWTAFLDGDGACWLHVRAVPSANHPNRPAEFRVDMFTLHAQLVDALVDVVGMRVLGGEGEA